MELQASVHLAATGAHLQLRAMLHVAFVFDMLYTYVNLPDGFVFFTRFLLLFCDSLSGNANILASDDSILFQ